MCNSIKEPVMKINKLKIACSIAIVVFSQSSFSQSSFDPYKAKPTYGKGCTAKNIEEAQGWLNLSYLSDIADVARQNCGWNFDGTKAAKLELISHMAVMHCYGESNAKKIEERFQAFAAITGSACNQPRINDLKALYAEKLSLISD